MSKSKETNLKACEENKNGKLLFTVSEKRLLQKAIIEALREEQKISTEK